MRIILALLIYFTSTLYAQNQIDFRGMPQTLIDHRTSQKISITFIGNTLFTNDFHKLGFAFFDLGCKYRINRSFGINLNYRSLAKQLLNDNFLWRNLVYFDFDFSKPMNRLTLGGTIRFQNQFIPGQMPILYNRSKINLKYRYSYYLQPFTEFELFTPVIHPTRNAPDQFRLSLGVNYNFNEKYKLESYYQLRKLSGRAANNTYHVFSLNFIYKL
jgi:hypothetical protein